MTPLRQRMIEDMRIRNFAATTQRSYVHYVAEFAKYFHRDPAELDLEAVRQYQFHLSQERKLSPQSINTFVSAVQFADSGGCRSAFRTDVDHDSEVMPISVPN
jgi:integrase/recombinase XerD